MDIITIDTASLGDRSYVLVDGGVAAVIDPQRDTDRIERVLRERGVQLTHVFETHVHNDYVTGGFQLAQRHGAAYVLSQAEDLQFGCTGASDGQEFQVGHCTVRAVHTPGHTPHHLSYVVARAGGPVAVFTGGSMLYGTVGRTDLIAADVTDSLTRAQFHSVRRLAAELPDDARVLPTHGFGSFCSSASGTGTEDSTIGKERATNLALTTPDEESFVSHLLAGLTAYPRYYAHMAPINRAGPPPVDLSPPEPVDGPTLERRLAAGEWVVDLRQRAAFARDHVTGTVNIAVGDSFATYLGWVLPWGTPVTVVGDTADDVAEAQRQMVRIGIDRPAGAADGGVAAWGRGAARRHYRAADFGELAAAAQTGQLTVVDVRRDDEWSQGSIAGALHIPIHDLPGRLDEVPEGEVWVHCASGYRASIAASLLDRPGRQVVVVDDDFDNAASEDALDVRARSR